MAKLMVIYHGEIHVCLFLSVITASEMVWAWGCVLGDVALCL